jgi:hypothetical protein
MDCAETRSCRPASIHFSKSLRENPLHKKPSVLVSHVNKICDLQDKQVHTIARTALVTEA